MKTSWFSPPGVGGVLQDKSFDGAAAFPAREVCNLTRVMLQAVRARDLPPKGSSFALCNTAIRACQPQNNCLSLSPSAFFGHLFKFRFWNNPPIEVDFPHSASADDQHYWYVWHALRFFNLTLVAVMLE